MKSSDRRKEIERILNKADNPISASTLAEKLNVSRQIIVGDIALLRAKGSDILATPRGYIFNTSSLESEFTFKIACNHNSDLAEQEIYTIIDNGGKLIDVIVEHKIYGQISGQLDIGSRYDAKIFIENLKAKDVILLSELTEGIHLHTILCKNENEATRIKAELKKLGILLEN